MESKYFNWALWLSIAGMAAITLLNQVNGIFYARQLAGDLEFVATYQGFARSALLTIVLALVMGKGIVRIIALIVGLALLYLLSARSEFAGFIVIGVMIMLLGNGLLRSSPILLVLVLASSYFLGEVAPFFDNDSRINGLLTASRMTLLEGRTELANQALNTIVQHPILGDRGSYLWVGGPGTYSHNILSTWVDFGLAGFLIVIGMLFWPLYKFLNMVLRRSTLSSGELLASALLAFSIVTLLFVKSINDVMVAATWGCIAGSYFTTKNDSRKQG